MVEVNNILTLINKHSKSLPEKPKLVICHDPYVSEVKTFNPADELNHLRPANLPFPNNFVLLTSSYSHSNQSRLKEIKRDQNDDSISLPPSSFVKSLCQVLQDMSDKYDVVTNLRMVTLLRQSTVYSNIYLKSSLQSLFYFKTDVRLSAFYPDAIKHATIRRDFSQYMGNVRINIPVKLFTRGEALFYPKSKSRCLILTYEETRGSKPQSIVHESDIKLLTNTFESLNFEVNKETNQDKHSSYEFLRKEALKDHSAYGCLVLFLFTNGNPKASKCGIFNSV